VSQVGHGLGRPSQTTESGVHPPVSKRFWAGIGVSVTLLAMFFLTVDVGRMLDALADADYRYVVPAAGMHLLAVLFRTMRWQWLLRHIRPIPVRRLYSVVVIGYMANNVLPMRLGELVRSYYVGEREGVSKMSALVTIFVERLLDALTLLLFISAMALFIPLMGLAEALSGAHGALWVILGGSLALVFVGSFGIVVSMALSPERAKALALRASRFLSDRFRGRIDGVVDHLLSGLVPLSSFRTVLGLLLVSLPIWLVEAGLFFVIGLAFDLHGQFYSSLWEMAVVMVLVTSIANLGSAIPAAPGGIGLFELVARETMVLLPLAAVDRDMAAAYVVVVHAVLLIPMIGLGQIFLLAQQASLGALWRAGQSAEPAEGRE